MKSLTLFASALIAIPSLLQAKAPKELLREAQANAAKSKKDVLMIFSGSEWHPQSKTFEEKILKTEPFKKGVDKNFVHILFNVPRTREEAHKHLLEFEQDYHFQNIPSAILTDFRGRPYAYSSETRDNVDEYLKHLGELHKVRVERDKAFAAAAKEKGLKRAELYVKALKALPQQIIRDYYAPELTLIADADKDGKTGYVAEIKKADALEQEQARYNLNFRNKKYDEIIKASQKDGKGLKGEDAQRIKMYEVQALYSLKKYDEAVAAIAAMKTFAPESDLGKKADQFTTQIKGAKTRAEKMAEAKKNPKPRKPIVSKPVAIVTDINELKKDAKKAEADLVKAIAAEKDLQTAKAESDQKIITAEAELKKLRDGAKKALDTLKKAVTEREKLARKAQAMKDVVENHEAMEKRKRDISELEKRASDLQKQADDLRKEADKIKKGK
ncbi:MAG: thioredoxin family protein [Akkermansiaceae bacterium]